MVWRTEWILMAAWLLHGSLACTTAQRCDPGESTALDYANLQSWVCHPGKDADVCRTQHAGFEVMPDNSLVPLTLDVAANPDADCFYVYPTVDLSVVPGVHDDFTDVEEQTRTTRIQASRLSSVCRVFAPLHRQVTLGTYGGNADRTQACFDTAFEDVQRAFDTFLAAQPANRPLILIGHSQGGQIVSRLMRTRLDVDAALRARVAGVLPLGWPLGTAEGSVVGGSSTTVPLCTTADQAGCLVGFRSFAAGNEFPEESGRFREGAVGVCVNPADVPDGGPARLKGTILNARINNVIRPPAGVSQGEDVDLLYRDYFSARCVPQDVWRGLEISVNPVAGDVRANPVDFDAAILSGKTGTHILDMQFTTLDVVDVVGRMVAARR